MVIQARKRVVLGFVVALLLAWCAASLSAQHMATKCKSLEPWSAEWIFLQCYVYAFPVNFEHRGFIVR